MLVTNLNQHTVRLDNFEGPLQFLLHLIQKSEIDIFNVHLRTITEQYLEKLTGADEEEVDSGAEFIGTTASLMWLKSKMLLPSDEQKSDEENSEHDPRFEIIHQLLDYARFKQLAKSLQELENKQNSYYLRGTLEPEINLPLGIEHINLHDLSIFFTDAIKRAETQKGVIHEELWRVADKIALIRALLRTHSSLKAEQLFSSKCCRDELIVTFLAVLELMKLGELRVHKQENPAQLVLTAYVE